jgi:hypothetical protein
MNKCPKCGTGILVNGVVIVCCNPSCKHEIDVEWEADDETG